MKNPLTFNTSVMTTNRVFSPITQEIISNEDIFLKELSKLSNIHNLGEVHYQLVYDCGTPEKVFSIKIPKGKSLREFDECYEDIIDSMEKFSKRNHMESYFKNSFIVLDY